MRSKLFYEKPQRTQIASERWVRIMPDAGDGYFLYDAIASDYLGRILFDAQGCWIYDGHVLSIAEQEDLAGYINRFQPEMDNLLKTLEGC